MSLSLVPDLSDLTSHICSAILNMFGVEGCFTPVRETSDQSELSAGISYWLASYLVPINIPRSHIGCCSLERCVNVAAILVHN